MRKWQAPKDKSQDDLKKSPKHDAVNNPSHYNSHPSGVECIQVAEHYNFNIGNVIKYVWRAGLKESVAKSAQDKMIEDLEKARWYLDREITRLKNQ